MNNIIYTLFIFMLFSCSENKKYIQISEWSSDINNKIENFLNKTQDLKTRKVAVFDGDGTVFGQVPFYLADEALYEYAEENYKGKGDSISVSKMNIIKKMVASGNNVSKEYVKDRVLFLSGLSTEQVENIGIKCFNKSYKNKFYPEMKKFIENLRNYNFEIWIITASPEILYQGFFSQELGIPKTNIIGVKSLVFDNKISYEIIKPIPQDDGKAAVIPTFIKVEPLIVVGNSRGDMDMINKSVGLKMIVNPDDNKIRKNKEDGSMIGYTVKSYWEHVGGLIVYCKDLNDSKQKFETEKWGIRKNLCTYKR